MRLSKIAENTRQLSEIPGLISCLFTHEIKSTKANIKYDGPKISRQVWQEVMAFLEWTNNEHHSESQLRLFVNTKLGMWKAWAFHQKAKTGMTAEELDNDESKKQRGEVFPSADGWVYFGTVHHHCSASAFQSGTDEANEKNQDGLHITVGKMDNKNLRDIHCRFYLGGTCFEPDMSWFWDIGAVIDMVPEEMRDKVARFQMCQPAPKDQAFPDQWKENVIEVKVEAIKPWKYEPGIGFTGGNTRHYTPSPGARNIEETVEELRDIAKMYDVEDDDTLMKFLVELQDNTFLIDIIELAILEKFPVDKMADELEVQMLKKEIADDEKAAKGKVSQPNTVEEIEEAYQSYHNQFMQ